MKFLEVFPFNIALSNEESVLLDKFNDKKFIEASKLNEREKLIIKKLIINNIIKPTIVNKIKGYKRIFND